MAAKTIALRALLAPKRPRDVAGGLVRHEQTVRHPLLEVPDDRGLVSGNRNRQHFAISGPELDDVSAVIFWTEDHNPVLARHFTLFQSSRQTSKLWCAAAEAEKKDVA